MKVSNVWRLLKIILIICRYQKIKAANIAQELEISTRQVYRDIDCLRLAGVPIYSDKEGYSLSSEFFMPKISLDLPEVLTLMMFIDSIQPQRGTPYFNFLSTAGQKIINLLPNNLKKIILENKTEGLVDFGLETRVNYGEIEHIFSKIYKAHMERKIINVEYFTMGREETLLRKIDPYALKFRFGLWYLIGYCHIRDEIRTFRIDRVKVVEITEDTFNIPGDFNLEVFFSGSWGIMKGKKTSVKLRFSPEIAKFISEVMWHPSQKLRKCKNGSLIATYEVLGLEEIKRWVLGFGREVKVLQPEVLRQQIVEEALQISRIY